MDNSEWMQKYEEDRKAANQKAKEFLLALDLGEYQYLVAFFDGSGDDGSVGKVLLSNEDAALDARSEGDTSGDEMAGVLLEKQQEITAAADTLTPDGFEDGAGGFGAVIVDIKEKKVKVNYSYRVEDSVENDFEV